MKIIFLAVIGLCLGSFVNALVWRLRQQSIGAKGSGQLSILHGRSMCTRCRHTLAWYDLLPVFSWLSLRGKCRYCQKPISIQYPALELATAALFATSYAFWPYRLIGLEWVSFAIWLVLLTGFMALAVYDMRWMELPNQIVYPLFGLVLAYLLFATLSYGSNNLRGAVEGCVVLGGLFLCLFYASKGRWIGGGDVKMGFVLGTWVGGFLPSLLVLFGASLLGSLAAGCLLLLGKNYKKVSFGPFLIAATILVQFFGSRILESYLTFALG